MFQTCVLRRVLVEVVGLSLLFCEVDPDHCLSFRSAVIFPCQAGLDICALRFDRGSQAGQLCLQFPKFRISLAEFCAEQSVLRLQISLLIAQHLQRGAGRTISLLLDNALRLGLCELFIQLLQSIGHDVVALVASQKVVLLLKLRQVVLRNGGARLDFLHLFREPL